METTVLVSDLLESPYPHCVIPPRFFDRMLARLDAEERETFLERGRDVRRVRV